MSNRQMPYSVAGRRVLAALVCMSAWSTLHAQQTPPPPPAPDFAHTPVYPIVSIGQGGTVSVLVDSKEHQVVLAGVAPPTTEVAGDRLQRFLENLLEAEDVLLQYEPVVGGDPRAPRRVYLFRAPDGLLVNLEVVRQGYAKVKARPACEHLKLLRHYERRAKQARKGVWAPRPRATPGAKATAVAAPATTKSGQTIVYVTKSGKKYHCRDCYHLRKSSQAISLKEAVEKGYEPCSHCKPPILETP